MRTITVNNTQEEYLINADETLWIYLNKEDIKKYQIIRLCVVIDDTIELYTDVTNIEEENHLVDIMIKLLNIATDTSKSFEEIYSKLWLTLFNSGLEWTEKNFTT